MKIKLFISILFAFFTTGISALKAETPIAICGDDSTSKTDYSGLSTSFFQQEEPEIPVDEKEVKAGLLYDAVNQKIVWEKNSSTPFPIASLTKLMVALLTVEDVRAGKFSWSDTVKWTREIIIGRGKNSRKVLSNVSYSLRDVFKASMIASNNECAEQMAKYISDGNLQAAVERMNLRAKELGMTNTNYGNPTGLPARRMIYDNSSTPSDLLLLTMEMLKYNEVTEIASMGYAAIENGKSTSVISNHNHLTIDYSGDVDGLKTGYTRHAGFCLVATTAKCDHRLVSIVLGCRGPQIRNEVVRDMIDNYYTTIGLDKLCPSPLQPSDANSSLPPGSRYITVNQTVMATHVVKSGETFSSIASKYRCSVARLKSWNKKSISGNSLKNGQQLVVYIRQKRNILIQPANDNEEDEDKPIITDSEKKDIDKENQKANAVTPKDAVTPKEEKTESNTSEKYIYYVVEPGDTLSGIAHRYGGTSVEQLKLLNGITNTRNLKPGTKLKVKVQS